MVERELISPDGDEAILEQPADDPPPPDQDLMKKLLRFIELKPRSSGETLDRIMRWGYGRRAGGDAVRYLESTGLLDDEEFARSFVDEMVRKGFGQRRVRQKLMQKRLDRRTLEAAMALYPFEAETERALVAGAPLVERMRIGDTEPIALERKITGFLMRRGFDPSAAREACRTLLDVDSDIRPE
jgi:regulatory protein